VQGAYLSPRYLAVLLYSTRTRCMASLDFTWIPSARHTHFHPPSVLYPIQANSATALGPRLQRCVDMSPPLADADPARASHPHRPLVLSRAVRSASFLCRLTPTLNTRLETGHHIVRAVLLCGHASISPARLDLMTIAPSLAAHGVCCPISAARSRILHVVLRIAWARRRCTIMASPPLNDELAPYLHALRGCSFASCNRNCRLSTPACYRSYPPRVRLLALSLSPARISFSGAYLLLHVSSPSVFRRIRMRSPTNFAWLSIQSYSPRQYRFCKSLLRAPLMVSIHPFSALATRNHPATLLITLIHLFSSLLRMGSPS
jgi:hypothetical protein